MAARSAATICAIVKDEWPHLLEWIAYYRVLGADVLLLYSNDCRDGTDEMLDRLADAGVVRHVLWPSRPDVSAQVTAYQDALGRADTRWLAFFDADEFLVLHRHSTLGTFLAGFEPDASAVAVNWRLFGSAGLVWRDPRPVIERFTRAAVRGSHVERHCKTIAVAADVEEAGVHSVRLRRGRYVDVAGNDVVLERRAFTPEVAHEPAQLNHYVLKSAAEYDAKVRRGNAHLPLGAPNKNSNRGTAFFRDHDRNDEEDRSALTYLPAMRTELARLEALLR